MKELCFIIETKKIYLEEVLVEYMGVPIFFLCKDSSDYYVSLCTDIDELDYIVVPVSVDDVYILLNGKAPMRNVILDQPEYWEIHSGSEILEDEVCRRTINEIDKNALPDEDACFKILTEEHRKYAEQFNEYYFGTEWDDIECDIDFNEEFNKALFLYFENLEKYRNLYHEKFVECIKLESDIRAYILNKTDNCKEISNRLVSDFSWDAADDWKLVEKNSSILVA